MLTVVSPYCSAGGCFIACRCFRSRSLSGTCSAVQASTKDGELVVRPKLTLGDSTNVADLREFNSYRRSIVRLLSARSSGLTVYSSSCAAGWNQ